MSECWLVCFTSRRLNQAVQLAFLIRIYIVARFALLIAPRQLQNWQRLPNGGSRHQKPTIKGYGTLFPGPLRWSLRSHCMHKLFTVTKIPDTPHNSHLNLPKLNIFLDALFQVVRRSFVVLSSCGSRKVFRKGL